MQFLVKVFALASVILVSQVSFGQSLTCRYNGSNYQTFNQSRGIYIGTSGYGFSSQSQCQDNLRAAGQSSICNWNGSNYQPHSIDTGRSIGSFGYGFPSLNACQSVATSDYYGFVCNWNGSNYQPYVSYSGAYVGIQGYGFPNVNDCSRATQGAAQGAVCNWNGSGYSVYRSVAPNQSVGSYGDLGSCVYSTSQGGPQPTPRPQPTPVPTPFPQPTPRPQPNGIVISGLNDRGYLNGSNYIELYGTFPDTQAGTYRVNMTCNGQYTEPQVSFQSSQQINVGFRLPLDGASCYVQLSNAFGQQSNTWGPVVLKYNPHP